MDILFVIVRLFISVITIPLLIYLILKGVFSYKDFFKNRLSLYFTLSLGCLAFSFIFYCIPPFLARDQVLLAEIAFGVNFFLVMLTLVFYIEYFHTLYRVVPFFSKLFYYAAGAGFFSLLFDPWKITYLENLGFNQSISDLLLGSILIQTLCMVVIVFRAMQSMKASFDYKMQATSISSDRINDVKSKKRRIDLISLGFVFGAFFGILGLIFPTSYLDILSTLIVFVPQAYIFSRDREMIIYLLAQKIRARTEDLQKSMKILQNQSEVSNVILRTEVLALQTHIL